MTPPSSSIAQLHALVEKLRVLLAQNPADRPWQAPESLPLLGDLGQFLTELWPSLTPQGAPLSQDLLDHLLETRLQACDRLAADLARQQQAVEQAQALWEQRARAARAAEAAAAQALREAQAAESAPSQAWKEARARVEALYRQCRGLSQWLHGVEPMGLNRFRDVQGRSFGREVVEEYSGRLHKMTEALKQARDLDSQCLAALQQARQAVTEAGERVRQAAQQRQALTEDMRQGSRQLTKDRAQAAALRADQAQAEEDASRAQELGRLHQEILVLAAGQLRMALMPSAPVSDPLAGMREQLDAAGRAGLKAQRLARLIQRQERRLALWGGQAQEAQGQAREINREIKRLEEGLPSLLAPLTSRDTATPPARAGASAKLSTMLARMEELAPGARRAHQQLAQSRLRLQRGLERCKSWLEAWRQQGKAERAHLQQAMALLEEARQAAGAQEIMAQELCRQVEPLAQALGGLPLADLWPSLAAVAQGVRCHQDLAARLRHQAGELDSRLGPPMVASLSRPPAVLKEHSALARRLSGQKVDLERLTAMLRAAKGWRSLLASPLLAQARAQAVQVAANLGASLSKIAAQQQRQQADRSRVAARLVRLRQELGQERRTGAIQGRDLRELNQKARSQASLIASLEDDLRQALAELAGERQAARRQVRELRASLSEQSQARMGLERSLEQSQNLLESQESLLEHRQARVQSLEQDLAQQEAVAGQQIAAMGRDLGNERQAGQEARRQLQDTRQRLVRREAAAVDLARRLREARHLMAEIRQEAQEQRQAAATAKHYLSRTQARNYRLKNQVRDLDNQLSLARQGQAAAVELMSQLEAAGVDMHRLGQRLDHSQHLARALREKALERHRLLQQTRVALAPLPYWQNQAQSLELESARLRRELQQARQDLNRAQGQIMALGAERDEARVRLASEQAARARQALDLLQGQTMAVELSATQTEASRWASLAGDLATALTLSGQLHQEEVGRLRAQVGELSTQAQTLRTQLDRLSLVMALYQRPASGQPARVRVASLTPAQMDRVLDRLAAVRGRLKELGRSTLGHWALIAALTTGLVTVAPNTPSKATHMVSPLSPARQEVAQLKQGLNYGPTFDIPAQASLHLQAPARADLELNLVPLRRRSQDLPVGVREQVHGLARRSGLSPQVLLTSARAAFGDREVVEPAALNELAEAARSLAQRHPAIFAELSQHGLPKQAQDIAKLEAAPDKAQHLFLDRLYREYRSLGFSPDEALGALAANERAIRGLKENWRSPGVFHGQVRPLASLETLTLTEFMARITPYMESRLEYYLKGGGVTFTGDIKLYAKNLAFDIYCAAKKFEVPVSLMLMIAHQETTFANVLGDSNRSASPFQIFEPTRKLIVVSMERNRFVGPPPGLHLERHLTMATYMAAFHLRELMQESYQPAGGGLQGHVDTDKVLKRYNGSVAYIGAVAARQRQLSSFLSGGT